jgi:hypothetical protein
MPPFYSNDTDDLYDSILDGSFEFPEDISLSRPAKALVNKILVTDDETRIPLEDILNDEWMVADAKDLALNRFFFLFSSFGFFFFFLFLACVRLRMESSSSTRVESGVLPFWQWWLRIVSNQCLISKMWQICESRVEALWLLPWTIQDKPGLEEDPFPDWDYKVMLIYFVYCCGLRFSSLSSLSSSSRFNRCSVSCVNHLISSILTSWSCLANLSLI